MKKTLIYSCVFFNEKYVELLRLLLKSYKLFGSPDESVDYLVICNPSFIGNVQKVYDEVLIDGKTWGLDLTTKFEAGFSRLFIFDYPDISQYDKILYLDCDILVTNNLNGILGFELEDKLYALKEGHTNHPFWGSQFFSNSVVKEAFSSGILLFKNSENMKTLFKTILDHISHHVQNNLPIPDCLDQPFIVFHAITLDLYNNEKLIGICINNSEKYQGETISHFPGGPGWYDNKIVRMSKFFKEELLNQDVLANILSGDSDRFNIAGKNYYWGDNIISFHSDNTMTAFGNGNFIPINKTLVVCYFGGRQHILKFSKDMKTFCSVRRDDFEAVTGEIYHKKIIPKIIMQTSKEKPSDNKVESIIKHFCPGWNYVHFSDEDIFKYFEENPLADFPNIADVFNSFSKGQHKADLFRYYYLYINGGIFLDSDAIFEVNVDNILKNYDSVFVKSFMANQHLFNGFIATYEKNPIIYDALKHAYNTNDKTLVRSYHHLCEELLRIYKKHSLPNMKVYQEHNLAYRGYGGSVILDDNGAKIVSHYWLSKNIPSEITKTYNTNYGNITLFKNDVYFIREFEEGKYWDEDTLCYLRDFVINKGNILEIGGHSGTSTLFYSKYFDNVSVFEPQKKMYNLLCQNMEDNHRENVSIYNKALFCYNGKINMNDTDIDGTNPNKKINVLEASNQDVNYGGLSIGKNGEKVTCVTLDSLVLDKISFIHCDAQGAEPFIFSKGKEFIKEHRPTILYENSNLYGNYLLHVIKESYPEYQEESKFDIKDYCVNVLGNYVCIDNFRNSNFDSLLIPYNKTEWNNYNKEQINDFDPRVLVGYDCPQPLVRVGPKEDGGYVIVDGFDYDHFLSCGIAGDIRFEESLLEKYPYLKCDAFDGTISSIPGNNKNINWINKNIGYINSSKITNLKPYLKNNKNIFLKMDIEGSEFNWIDSMSLDELNCFSQIVMEIHWPFDKYRCDMLKKINKTHYVVHIHGNNYCDRDIPNHLPSGRTYDGTQLINHKHYPTINLPEVFEITYVRRKNFVNELADVTKIYPIELDSPNNPNAKEVCFTILNH